MLSEITWNTFLVIIGCCMALWYLAIALLFYRNECLSILSGEFLRRRKDARAKNEKQVSNTRPTEDFFADAHQLRNRVEQRIHEAAKHRYPKSALLANVTAELRCYSFLKNTAFQVAINNFIDQQVRKECSLEIHEQELSEIWSAGDESVFGLTR